MMNLPYWSLHHVGKYSIHKFGALLLKNCRTSQRYLSLHLPYHKIKRSFSSPFSPTGQIPVSSHHTASLMSFGIFYQVVIELGGSFVAGGGVRLFVLLFRRTSSFGRLFTPLISSRRRCRVGISLLRRTAFRLFAGDDWKGRNEWKKAEKKGERGWGTDGKKTEEGRRKRGIKKEKQRVKELKALAPLFWRLKASHHRNVA